MKRSDLTDFEVEEEGFKLRIRRSPGQLPVVATPATYLPAPVTPNRAPEAVTPPATSAASAAPAGAGDDRDEPGIVFIKSPMVGTFYRSPSPDSPPFADVNTKVTENSVVCIIEAMKIMNEIQAEVKGTIVEVLLENGQPVEYGQRLFKVRVG